MCGYCWSAVPFLPLSHGWLCSKCGTSYHPWVKDPLVYPDTYAGDLIYPPSP